MDNGKGIMEMADSMSELKEKVKNDPQMAERLDKDDGVFHEGEIVELKGSRFKISGIRPKKMILKLLPRT